MLRSCMLISFICNVFLYSGFVNGEEESEADIREKVLQDYDPSIPPDLYSELTHIVYISLRVFRITGLDEKKGEFSIEGILKSAWIDARFSWEPNTIEQFSVEHKSIWMPSIYIYNGIEPEEITLDPLPVIVQGGAYWEPRYNIKTSCNINLRYYPFDKQVCDIIVTSRTREGDFISSMKSSPRTLTRAYISEYKRITSHEWTYSRPAVFLKKMKTDSNSLRDAIVLRFFVQRSMPLIPLGILAPCLCCTLLLLTTFWMPIGSTLRAGICVTAMLISSSSLFTLGKLLPASGSSTPIIVEYVAITLILSAVSSIQATISSIFTRCEKLPPVSYSRIISRIPRWCLFLMGIAPEEVISQQLEQKFLFSELDAEDGSAGQTFESNEQTPQNSQPESLQSLWLKYITLFDRVMFYLLGIIILLFIISVIVTE